MDGQPSLLQSQGGVYIAKKKSYPLYILKHLSYTIFLENKVLEKKNQ